MTPTERNKIFSELLKGLGFVEEQGYYEGHHAYVRTHYVKKCNGKVIVADTNYLREITFSSGEMTGEYNYLNEYTLTKTGFDFDSWLKSLPPEQQSALLFNIDIIKGYS